MANCMHYPKLFYWPLAVLPLFLQACTTWPQAGRGGFAEHTAKPLYPIEIATPADDVRPLNLQQGLRLDVAIAQQNLNTLRLQGADVCFPAQVATLTLAQNRIERELHGGLTQDAAVNLQRQHYGLALLRHQLAHVNPKITCQIIATAPQVQATSSAPQGQQALKKQILNLVNSDNQFAHNSAAINPKYAQRLSAASQLLQTHPWPITLTGHTDNTGSTSHNQQLANLRAQTVANWLVQQGIKAERITVVAVASAQPYSPLNAPEDHLVNRRVTLHFNNATATTLNQD